MIDFDSFWTSDPRYECGGLRFATAGSPALGRRGDVCTYAPPGTPEGAPLVVALHGVLDSHWHWALRGGAHRVLERLVADGRVRPMVLAMPSDGLWGKGSAYVSLPGEDAETWIRDEVPAVASLLHPGAGDAGVCIAGLSMGGFGALRLAGTSPERYVAAAGTSSATSIARVAAFTGHHYPLAAGRGTLAEVLTTAAAPVPIRFDCGTDDDLLEENRALHRALTDAGIAHEYAEFPGGHEWSYWTARFAEILEFFERCLAEA